MNKKINKDRFAICLSHEVRIAIKKYCGQNLLSCSAVIEELLVEYLKKKGGLNGK